MESNLDEMGDCLLQVSHLLDELQGHVNTESSMLIQRIQELRISAFDIANV